MIQIDERIDSARLQQFASQVDILPPLLRSSLEQSFLLEGNADFYYGQAAALVFSYAIVSESQEKELLGSALAVVSKYIVDQGWT